MSTPRTSTSDPAPDPSPSPPSPNDPGRSAEQVSPPSTGQRPPRRGRFRTPLLLAGTLAAVACVGYWQWDRSRARRTWAEAEHAIARHDLAAAAAHLDRYLALRPEDPAGWFLASRTARRRGLYADAKRYLIEYEKRGGVADAVRLERDLLLVQQGVIGEIDVRLRATVEPDHPDAVFVLEALARGYQRAERWSDARQACEMWRALRPDDPRPWLWSGLVAERMVQVEQAAEFHRRALELDPEDRDARVAFARVLSDQRKPAEAAPHYEWVVARNPDDADALLGLARCRIEEGRATEAPALIARAVARDPKAPRATSLRGRAAMETGDLVGAERWLREAARAEPSDAEALHLLVLCLRAQRKGAEADQLAGRLEGLQKDLRRLTELMRTITPRLADAEPCHEAGVIALRLGRTQQGENLLNDALRRKGDHRQTHAALATHYRQAGKLDLAQHHQNLADKP